MPLKSLEKAMRCCAFPSLPDLAEPQIQDLKILNLESGKQAMQLFLYIQDVVAIYDFLLDNTHHIGIKRKLCIGIKMRIVLKNNVLRIKGFYEVSTLVLTLFRGFALEADKNQRDELEAFGFAGSSSSEF